MASPVKFAKSFLIPKVILDTLKNQDPKVLGKDSGKTLKRVIRNEISKKAYMGMEGRLISWLDGFYGAFRREMYGD